MGSGNSSTRVSGMSISVEVGLCLWVLWQSVRTHDADWRSLLRGRSGAAHPVQELPLADLQTVSVLLASPVAMGRRMGSEVLLHLRLRTLHQGPEVRTASRVLGHLTTRHRLTTGTEMSLGLRMRPRDQIAMAGDTTATATAIGEARPTEGTRGPQPRNRG